MKQKGEKREKQHERKTPPSCNLIEEELSETENYSDCRSAVRDDHCSGSGEWQSFSPRSGNKMKMCERTSKIIDAHPNSVVAWRESWGWRIGRRGGWGVFFPISRFLPHDRQKNLFEGLPLLTHSHTQTFTHSLTASSGERNGVAVHLFPCFRNSSDQRRKQNSFRSSIPSHFRPPSFLTTSLSFFSRSSPADCEREELLVISLVIA